MMNDDEKNESDELDASEAARMADVDTFPGVSGALAHRLRRAADLVKLSPGSIVTSAGVHRPPTSEVPATFTPHAPTISPARSELSQAIWIDGHGEFVAHVAALVAALPKCTACLVAVAMKARERGGDRFCDACDAKHERGARDYPRAPELRWVIAALARMRP